MGMTRKDSSGFFRVLGKGNQGPQPWYRVTGSCLIERQRTGLQPSFTGHGMSSSLVGRFDPLKICVKWIQWDHPSRMDKNISHHKPEFVSAAQFQNSFRSVQMQFPAQPQPLLSVKLKSSAGLHRFLPVADPPELLSY